MNKLFFSSIRSGTVLFNRFKAIRCISAGNLGGVYLCSRIEDETKFIALKILSTSASKDSETAASFKREMDLSCKIDHANVLRARDYYEDDDFTAFSMEFVRGGTLSDRMEPQKPFKLHEAIRIIAELGAGLQAIHSSAIVHRDLKPENILIDKDGTVKIADFGIALLRGSHEFSKDELIGTMNYLSPEYVANGDCDERSDIYALGVIAYELITGRLPFQGRNLLESLRMRVITDPTPPHMIITDCPRALSDLVMKAIKRNVNNRYQFVTDLMKDLSPLYELEVISTWQTQNGSAAPISLGQEPTMIKWVPVAA